MGKVCKKQVLRMNALYVLEYVSSDCKIQHHFKRVQFTLWSDAPYRSCLLRHWRLSRTWSQRHL